MRLLLFWQLHYRYSPETLRVGVENQIKKSVRMPQMRKKIMPRMRNKVHGVPSQLGRGMQRFIHILMWIIHMISFFTCSSVSISYHNN